MIDVNLPGRGTIHWLNMYPLRCRPYTQFGPFYVWANLSELCKGPYVTDLTLVEPAMDRLWRLLDGCRLGDGCNYHGPSQLWACRGHGLPSASPLTRCCRLATRRLRAEYLGREDIGTGPRFLRPNRLNGAMKSTGRNGKRVSKSMRSPCALCP